MRLPPKFTHIATKGIVSLRKSICLATKGIIDQIKVAKPIPRGGILDIYFPVYGIKAYPIYAELIIIGTKSYETERVAVLVGQKQTSLAREYALRATLLKELTTFSGLVGAKSFSLENELVLSGTKKFELARNLILSGTRQHLFNLEKGIVARRLYPIIEKSELVGSKQMVIDTEIPLEGKQDNTNILVALDMIGGGQ